MRGRLREAGVVAGEKAVKDALGVLERPRLGEAQFDDEAILKGAKEAFDPALRLGRMGADPADAEFLECATDLGGLGPALELLGQAERGAGVAVEDPMPIGVGGPREAIAPDEVAQEEEVAVGILLEAEDSGQDAAGGIINGGQQHEPRATILQPGVLAAIHLDEEAGLRHALAATAMAGRPAGAWATDPGGAEEPLHRPTRQAEALAFGE
jgi:hypothetical protein